MQFKHILFGHKQLNSRTIEDFCFSSFKKLELPFKVAKADWRYSNKENLHILFVYNGGKRVRSTVVGGKLIGQIQIDYINQKVKWLFFDYKSNDYIFEFSLDVEKDEPEFYLDTIAELILKLNIKHI